MKKKIENEALQLFYDCCKYGLNTSYRSVLNSMYDTASERKQYLKCSLITELISEDINS